MAKASQRAAAVKAVDIDLSHTAPALPLGKPASDAMLPAKPASGRQADTQGSAAGDLKAQAAEGVAAFRARFEKNRQVQPAKTPADLALEQLKAAVEATRAKEAAAQKSRQSDRGRPGHELPPRDKSKDGPDFDR